MPQDVVVTGAYRYVAGAVCLDFINTVSRAAFAHDPLSCYADVIRWAKDGELISSADRTRLSRLASGNPRAAERERKRLIALRSLLSETFTQIAAGKRIGQRDLRAFNVALAAASRNLAIVRNRTSLHWSHESGAGDLAFIRRCLIWDAARLLTSGRLSKLRSCASPTCTWLFLDESRRGNRRWCSMSDCGSRAKARRYYARKKAVSGRSVDKRPRRRRPRRRGPSSSSR
ncbi:MAG: CGNR zinc finger domain-containing protein [Thermoanaerobaculia bacterium]